jgi:hypothetical protein
MKIAKFMIENNGKLIKLNHYILYLNHMFIHFIVMNKLSKRDRPNIGERLEICKEIKLKSGDMVKREKRCFKSVTRSI